VATIHAVTASPPADRRTFVVCGDDPLALRLVDELVTRYSADVTVILPSAERNHGPQIGRIPGIRVVEADRLDVDALQAAGIAAVDALALVRQDDVGNIDAALIAQELNPSIRLVVRMFNMSLGHGIRRLFNDCTVLSDASIAAPAMVAAALGEVEPSRVRLPGRTVFVARREDVAERQVLCGLAITERNSTRDQTAAREILPADQRTADLVLAVADSSTLFAGTGEPRRRRLPPLRLPTLMSAVHMIRAALPHMKDGGAILTVTSSSIREPIPRLGLSTVMRSGVAGLVKTLADELAEDRIRVNNLMPGRIDTDRVRQLDENTATKLGLSVEEVQRQTIEKIPLKRLGTIDDFGKAAAFLLSPAAAYITGASLRVDGGAMRSI